MMVMDDRRVKLREIASAVGISSERVHNIVHQHLDMKKLSARWVPRLLTVDQKQNRVRCTKDGLQLFQRNPQDFRRCFVTVDETWIHHYTPEASGKEPRNSPNNGLPAGSLHQKRRRPFLRPGRLWQLSFGIRKE
ncbi:histone-lysine n-methyltransferase setmar [Lasius niger]|uniref:Histone-lysine n-methyltransferase setmar n=1 Tax=Lasius niger TaxID=67767 RepID=A0A0J7KNM7_LASNI|nr:histone-lysine n-methyltransferase setmar [Lasius niger]